MSETVSNVDVDLAGKSPMLPQFEGIVVKCTTGNVAFEFDDRGYKHLKIPLVFEQEATAVDGRKVPVGFSGCTADIGMFTVGKRDKEMIERDVLRAQCAILGITQGKALDLAELSGRPVQVSFTRRQDKQDATKFFQDYKFMAAK